jgi:hypothetical protein
MQFILGIVHLRWCIFLLHNQSLTWTLTDHMFLSNQNTKSWFLNLIIIILWLYPNSIFNTYSQEADSSSLVPPHAPHDRMTTLLGNVLSGWTMLCLFDCLHVLVLLVCLIKHLFLSCIFTALANIFTSCSCIGTMGMD